MKVLHKYSNFHTEIRYFTLTIENSQDLFSISLEPQVHVRVNFVLTEDDHLLSHEILVVEC